MPIDNPYIAHITITPYHVVDVWVIYGQWVYPGEGVQKTPENPYTIVQTGHTGEEESEMLIFAGLSLWMTPTGVHESLVAAAGIIYFCKWKYLKKFTEGLTINLKRYP